MLKSKFINSYLIEKDNKKLLVFYNHDEKYLLCEKELSEEEKKEIIEHLESSYYSYSPNNENEQLVEFSEIMKMTEEITKRKDSDVCRRNKL
jgi:hypothetical protein